MKSQAGQKGVLANAFNKPFWNTRIKSANATKKEMWLGYVLGPWGILMTNSIVNSYFNQYLTDVLGFTVSKAAWIATFMVAFPLVSKIMDAITNLLMCKLIDMTVCKQGKVRPWFIISAPLVAISVILMFCMPFTSVFAQAVWVVFTFNLYYCIAYTMWNMAKELSPALSTRNVNQRKNNAMALTITANIGTGLVSILFPLILNRICAAVNGDNAKGYFLAMTMIGCIALPLALIQYFYTRERVTEERRNQVGIVNGGAVETEVKPEASTLEQLKACLKSKYWILFVLVILLTSVLSNIRNISLVYYCGWIVNGNSYGTFATIQAKFQMIAMSPMGPGLLIMLPLMRKIGRRNCIWGGGVLTTVGSIMAYMNAGNSMMIYAGTALAAIGNIAFTYTFMSYLGDVIDFVEWKTKVRCDGITGGFVGVSSMLAIGLAQAIFNLGLMVSGYNQPEVIGTTAEGINLYADQLSAANGWINFAYQGTYIIIGIIVFTIFCFVFKLDDFMPKVSAELEERKVAECKAQGIKYIPHSELERIEREKAFSEAEEIRIKELKEQCQKKGLDFDTENQKVLDKRTAKEAKKAAKRRS